MSNHRTAAISYSHDSAEYIQWVHDLANDLRKNGVDAKTDRMESQHQTVHFKQMMNQLLREKDYVIVMLTEQYAKKVEDFTGGAGYEGQIISQMIQDEPDRLIFCLYGQDLKKSIPHHLQGYYFIDFRNPDQYQNNIKEIVNRIYKINSLHIEPLGPNPAAATSHEIQNFKNENEDGRSTLKAESAVNWMNIEVPKRKPTDLEKARFLKEEFKSLVNNMDSLLNYVGRQRSEFEYEKVERNNNDFQFNVYVEGKKATGVRIWMDSGFGSERIAMAYGIQHGYSNGMNEMIMANVNDHNKLELNMMMGRIGLDKTQIPNSTEEIAKYVWKEHMQNVLK